MIVGSQSGISTSDEIWWQQNVNYRVVSIQFWISNVTYHLWLQYPRQSQGWIRDKKWMYPCWAQTMQNQTKQILVLMTSFCQNELTVIEQQIKKYDEHFGSLSRLATGSSMPWLTLDPKVSECKDGRCVEARWQNYLQSGCWKKKVAETRGFSMSSAFVITRCLPLAKLLSFHAKKDHPWSRGARGPVLWLSNLVGFPRIFEAKSYLYLNRMRRRFGRKGSCRRERT